MTTDKIFLPGALDVGHRLRLEVRASAAGTGQLSERVVTQVAETQPVLPRPPPATHRRYILAPDIAPPPSITDKGEREAWMQRARREGLRNELGGGALKVCCWNILAEIYASGQQVSGGVI